MCVPQHNLSCCPCKVANPTPKKWSIQSVLRSVHAHAANTGPMAWLGSVPQYLYRDYPCTYQFRTLLETSFGRNAL